jgi:hypothetical protein
MAGGYGMSVRWFAEPLWGLQQAQQRFEQAAADIARAGPARASATAPPSGGDNDLLGPTVRLLTAKHAFSANLATMRAADRCLGLLIDVFA